MILDIFYVVVVLHCAKAVLPVTFPPSTIIRHKSFSPSSLSCWWDPTLIECELPKLQRVYMFLMTGLSPGLIHLTLLNSNFWKDCQSLVNNSKATMNCSVTYIVIWCIFRHIQDGPGCLHGRGHSPCKILWLRLNIHVDVSCRVPDSRLDIWMCYWLI